MRRTACLLAALLVLPSLGSDAPKEYDGAAEMRELDGVWRRTALTINGGKAYLGAERTVTFGHESVVYRVGTIEVRGTYTTDRSKTPAHLDETFAGGPNVGRVWMNLYRVEGDTLRIAYSDEVRPRDFADSTYIETYQRVK